MSKRTVQASLCIALVAAGTATATPVFAQVPLSSYTDKDGYVDVQKLTCAQLIGTWQEDADLLAAWYSGWYNGLAKAHRAKIGRIKEDEHLVIVHCKANPQMTIIKAIDAVFKGRR